jgi:hypothetical protein
MDSYGGMNYSETQSVREELVLVPLGTRRTKEGTNVLRRAA